MTTEWFDKEAGSPVAIGRDDPTMMLVGADAPDWVRLPDELGGQRVRVTLVKVGPCPRGDHDVRHMELEGDVHVAECPAHGGFLWYRPAAT